MIKLSSSGTDLRFIENLLRIKQLNYEVHPQRLFKLQDFKNTYNDPVIAALYLNERYPVPELLQLEPGSKYSIVSIMRNIQNEDFDARLWNNVIKNRLGFIMGRQLTLLDLYIEPRVNDAKYSTAVQFCIANSLVTL